MPGSLLSNWNLDPILIAALLAVLLGYCVGAERGAVGRRQRLAFLGGWTLVTLAFVSPLCSLSVALFSARVAQHMLLTLIAAPLLALGEPERALARLLGREWDGGRGVALGAAAFAVALWFWHAPAPYDATFDGAIVYWTMHVTLLAAAYLLWRTGIVALRDGRAVAAITAGLASSLQMGLLGAILTFGAEPVYAAHALTTLSWGLTSLEDQQLGGLIMWLPGGTAFLAAALWAVGELLREPA